ncbi:NADH-quinone oxidoreductase subunit NuoE [Motiliproteus sp. MSK22-1]|uniref:NADH-quinone oxidoreductase subunit NuoE n=1 Tax=Motiliproteus sp. MSK22-1 TaxID=1897630 RepID=UPI000977F9CD|nr:NADH-quinone oxidoreductase subunit NuoE [Motiliproteus sp. MSK22-1]OMH36139.1 NADH-quinone oxidoreductase subunit E [Motiliproteus sp. MSK22-1]
MSASSVQTLHVNELSTEERREIEAECAHYPQRRAAAIEGLKVVQKYRGWVSDSSIEALARFLQMPAGELEGVATFYNLIFRQPVGKHVIMLCDSVCCWIKGSDKMRQHLTHTLGIQPGETTPDGLITLLPIVCLGDCDRAPTLMIDDQQHGNLTTEKVDELIAAIQNTSSAKKNPPKSKETKHD